VVDLGLLDTESLIRSARANTGLDDFGGDSWREGLEQLVTALRTEAQLNDIGVQLAAADITGHLAQRLEITEWHRRNPAMAEADVTPPIVIMGQPRTGTTILFDLLAQDPAHRVPLTWEVDRPIPPPETATYDTDARIDEVQATLDMTELLIPGFLAMHPMGARLGQECVRITGGDFRTFLLPTVYRVPSYGQWLVYDADMAPAYAWHRRFLQLLQWRHPGTRWLLKSPAHLWCLPALLAEYPGALLVQTHRDPCTVVASVSSLVSLLRRMNSDAPDIVDIASEWVDYILTGLDRSVDARVDGTVPPGQVIDVQFDTFMADPFGTIAGVYERFGFELTREAEQRMRAFLADHGRERHGKHEYAFADTGLDEDDVRERARRYIDYFGVAPG
jgi:hypothetical protein